MPDNDAIDNDVVVAVLSRAVWVINPVLDILTAVDPLGLKGRTWVPRHDRTGLDVTGRALDAMAWVLNTAAVPGTSAWAGMDVPARARWWVCPFGALSTVLVAYPGVFGVLVKWLPVQATLGYSNQAIVLVAVARENGLTDQEDHVRMLAHVLNKRVVNQRMPVTELPDHPIDDHRTWAPLRIGKGVWRLTQMVRGLGDELGKRPQPTKVYRYLGMVPVVGAVAGYVGEYKALGRAAATGQRWVRASLPVAGV